MCINFKETTILPHHLLKERRSQAKTVSTDDKYGNKSDARIRNQLTANEQSTKLIRHVFIRFPKR